MSTIQGVETKYNETYFLYDEVYFVIGQRRSVPFA